MHRVESERPMFKSQFCTMSHVLWASYLMSVTSASSFIKMEIMRRNPFEESNEIECKKGYIAVSSETVHSQQVFIEHVLCTRILDYHFIEWTELDKVGVKENFIFYCPFKPHL